MATPDYDITPLNLVAETNQGQSATRNVREGLPTRDIVQGELEPIAGRLMQIRFGWLQGDPAMAADYGDGQSVLRVANPHYNAAGDPDVNLHDVGEHIWVDLTDNGQAYGPTNGYTVLNTNGLVDVTALYLGYTEQPVKATDQYMLIRFANSPGEESEATNNATTQLPLP